MIQFEIEIKVDGRIAMESILHYDTVCLDEEHNELVIIDQTKLPNEIQLLHLKGQEEIWEAIRALRVRGAPAIGVAAAIGLYLAARESKAEKVSDFKREIHAAAEYLNSSRPTAVNLSWALKRMERVLEQSGEGTVSDLKESLRRECISIYTEDIDVCRRLGEYGLTLTKPGWGLLTHCNAGQLATVRYGTATAPMYLGQERGYGFRVYCDETRPLLQGARLTSYELSSAGIDTTLICDNMAASLMKQGKIQAVFVGCDRVAANGDAANKIGTLGVAILAKHFGIPFYVVAPSSTIDLKTPTGNDIVIEERDAAEVREMWYENPMAAKGVEIWNPAFDVTDHTLITAIVTEFGVLRAPYDQALRELMKQKENV